MAQTNKSLEGDLLKDILSKLTMLDNKVDTFISKVEHVEEKIKHIESNVVDLESGLVNIELNFEDHLNMLKEKSTYFATKTDFQTLIQEIVSVQSM